MPGYWTVFFKNIYTKNSNWSQILTAFNIYLLLNVNDEKEVLLSSETSVL